MFKIGIEGHNLEQSRAGVARMLTEELRGLAQIPFVRENIRFILYFKAKPPADDFLNDTIFEKKILPYFIRPSSLVFYNIVLPYFAVKDKVDLCYFACYMLPLFYRGKSIVTLHDVAYEAHPEWFPPYHRYSYHILSRRAAKNASAILTISEFSKREIIKYYPNIVGTEKIHVIPLAVSESFQKINDQEKISRVKQKYGIKNNFIFFLGQIFTRRHVYESTLAFEKIVSDFPDMQFLVIGRDLTFPTLKIDELTEKINKKAGREAVVRKKYVESDDDLVLLFNAAKLFVYLSEYEGFGLPPIEAIACGTPILIARSGASDEVFGDAAFYVENPKNTDEIAQKIKLALLDEEQRARIVELGKERVKKFGWRNHCEKLSELFQKILKK